MATQARAVLKIPARIVGAGNVSVALQNGIYTITGSGGSSGHVEVNYQSGTSYTVQASDDLKLLVFDNVNPITVTLPSGLGLGFSFRIVQVGAGTVTLVGDTGVSVNALGHILTTPGQFAVGWVGAYAPNAFVLAVGSQLVASTIIIDRETSFSGHGSMTTTGPIDATAITSAGVFDATGVLVRTLWVAEAGNPNRNNPAAAWDGTIEAGATLNSVAPSGNYTIKVVAHKFTYTWEGVLGNTSPDHSTPYYWAQNSPLWDMEAAPDGKIWYAAGYHERKPTFGYFTASDPQNMNTGRPNTGQWGPTTGVTTDGTITYFALNGPPESFIYGINIAAQDFVAFSSGTTFGGVANVAIAYSSSGSNFILNIAVQRTGNFLYAVKPDANTILTLNKTTGAILQTNTSFVSPRLIEVNPNNDNLWLCHSVSGIYRITKCAVDGSGNVTLTATQTTYSFTGVPSSISISPDGATMLVTDPGTHQIVAFNTSDASLKTAFGTTGRFGVAGGYSVSPEVTTTKWMFSQAVVSYAGNAGLVCFGADASIWVGDGGNCRHLHFSSGNSPAYITQVMYQPIYYACQVCKGDPTRIFVGYREFSVNYSLPLSTTNGSWTLVRNWGQAVIDGDALLDAFNALKYVGVYSNGKTYAANAYDSGTSNLKWFELTTGGLRDTGQRLDPNMYVDTEMNLYYFYDPGVGVAGGLYGNAFTGFDGSDNPTWALGDIPAGSLSLVLATEAKPTWMCKFGNQNNGPIAPWAPGVPTSNNIIPCADHNGMTGHTGSAYTPFVNHMGGVDATTGKFRWAHYPVHGNVAANAGQDWMLFPESPYFAVGSGTGVNSGGLLLFDESLPHIFFNHIGEGGWGNNQINIWMHYHDSGLPMARFGTVMPFFAASSLTDPNALTTGFPSAFTQWKGQPQATGNSRWGGHALVNNVFYIYQSDEWYHGGLHRWKVEGLNTLRVDSVAVVWNSASYVPPTTNPNKLLAGLPYDSANVPNSTAGWTRFPTTNATGVSLRTNVIKNNPRNPPDLTYSVTLSMGGGDAYVVRSVTRVGAGNWTISGKIYLQIGFDAQANPNDNSYMSFQILDNTDKVILDLHAYTVGLGGPTGYLTVNNSALLTYASDSVSSGRTKLRSVIQREVSFSVAANVGAGTMSVNYGGTVGSRSVLEGGASLTNVAKVRLWHKTIATAAAPPSPNGVSITELQYSEP